MPEALAPTKDTTWTKLGRAELNEALRLHKRFLAGEAGGRRALLSYRDLSGHDLSYHDLSQVD